MSNQMNPIEIAVSLRDVSLQRLAGIVHQNAIDHGFHPSSQKAEDWLAHMLCNMHGEVAELYEAYRSGNLHEPCDKAQKMAELGLASLTCAEEEYADIVIRALDQASRLGLDIARAVAAKHAYNTTRPFKHGRLS